MFHKPPQPVLVTDDQRILQEQLRDAYGEYRWELLWAMACLCTLLTRSKRSQAVAHMNVLIDIMTPYELVAHPDAELHREIIVALLTPAGLPRVKANRIVEISRRWVYMREYGAGLEIYGVLTAGTYFHQSWEMVVLGRFPPRESVTDPYLQLYYDRKYPPKEAT